MLHYYHSSMQSEDTAPCVNCKKLCLKINNFVNKTEYKKYSASKMTVTRLLYNWFVHWLIGIIKNVWSLMTFFFSLYSLSFVLLLAFLYMLAYAAEYLLCLSAFLIYCIWSHHINNIFTMSSIILHTIDLLLKCHFCSFYSWYS